MSRRGRTPAPTAPWSDGCERLTYPAPSYLIDVKEVPDEGSRACARGSVLPLLNRSDAVRRGLPCEHGYGGGRGGHDLLLLRFNAETIPNAVHGHREGGTAPRGRTFDRRSGRSGRDLVRGAEQRHRKDGRTGRWSADIAPGTYTVTARNPNFNNGHADCAARNPVTVVRVAVTTIQVLCVGK
jgi:hypothetical protein